MPSVKRETAIKGRTKITPPELARRWGIDTLKVLRWIRTGELRAIDAGTRRGQKKPRFLIDMADLAAFEAARSVTPPTPRMRRRKADPSVIQFF